MNENFKKRDRDTEKESNNSEIKKFSKSNR